MITQEAICSAITCSWRVAHKAEPADHRNWWQAAEYELSGIQSLAIYAGANADLLDDIRLLLRIARDHYLNGHETKEAA